MDLEQRMKMHQERLNTLTKKKPKKTEDVDDGRSSVVSGLSINDAVDGSEAALKPKIRPGKWVYGKGFVVDDGGLSSSSSSAATLSSTAATPNTIEGTFEEMRRKRSEITTSLGRNIYFGLNIFDLKSNSPEMKVR